MFSFLKLFIPVFCDLDQLSICCILYCDPLTIPFIIFYHSFKLHYSCPRKRLFSRDVNLLRTTSIRTAVLRAFRDRVNCLLATHLKVRLVKKHFFVVISINYGILLNVSVKCAKYLSFSYIFIILNIHSNMYEL